MDKDGARNEDYLTMIWNQPQKTEKLKQQRDKLNQATQRIAYKIYQNRLLLSKSGDQISDWQLAERIARNPLRRTLYLINQPLIKAEKRYWEPLLAWANNQALLNLLGILSNIGILIAAGTYIGSEKQRRDAEIYTAWQTITSAYGQPGNGGRKRALEFLNASPVANWRLRVPWICTQLLCLTWPSENLDGVEVETAYLSGINLENADLNNSKFSRSVLTYANLRKTNLEFANLEGANLKGSVLREANLWGANLKRTELIWTNLEDAILNTADLQEAYIDNTNFHGSELARANLTKASLEDVNLSDAYMPAANLSESLIEESNLQNAILIKANFEQAKIGTTLERLEHFQSLTPECIHYFEDVRNGVSLFEIFSILEQEQNTLCYSSLALATEATDLSHADLSSANLANAKLGLVNLEGATLSSADLREVVLWRVNLSNATIDQSQLEKSKLCLTQLPNNVNLNPNRNCEELGVMLNSS